MSEIPQPAIEIDPLESAMQTARKSVLDSQEFLVGAGIAFTPEQLQNAANLAAEKVQKEHLAKESQDPLVRIADILNECAQTDEEKAWAAQGAKNLSEFRSAWQELHQIGKQTAEARGERFSIEVVIVKAISRSTPLPSFATHEYNPQKREYITTTGSDVLGWEYGEGEKSHDVISIPVDYLQRVSQRLSPSLAGISLNNAFYVFPQRSQAAEGKPYADESSIRNLPGEDPNIHFTLFEPNGPRNRLFMSMGVDTLQKIIDFTPASS